MQIENLLVFPNTKDRINVNVNAGSSDYAFPIDSISDRRGKATFHMLSAEIPNVMYPISAARRNNTLYFYEDGSTATTYEATIDDNAYTGSQLASALKTAMDAAGTNVYTITYDSQSLKITIATDGTSVAVTTGTNSMNDELGIDSTQAFSDPYVCAYAVNLSGTKYIDVDIRNYNNLNVSSSSSSAPLYRIQMAVPFGSIMYHRAFQNEMIRIHVNELRNLTINLYDDKGILISIPDNHHISMTMKLTFDYSK